MCGVGHLREEKHQEELLRARIQGQIDELTLDWGPEPDGTFRYIDMDYMDVEGYYRERIAELQTELAKLTGEKV